MRDARAAAARPRLALSVSSKGCFGCRRGTGRAQRVVLKNTSGWIRTCPRASSQGRGVTPHGPGSGALSCWTEFCYVRVSAIERSYVGASVRTRTERGRAVRASERGATTLSLLVLRGNPSFGLYERLGYVAKKQSSLKECLDCCCFSLFFGSKGYDMMYKQLAPPEESRDPSAAPATFGPFGRLEFALDPEAFAESSERGKSHARGRDDDDATAS